MRALGGGHSFTAAAATSGAALDLSGWTGIVGADLASGLITARSGTTIRELNRALDSLGLAMPNLGDIDAQTISGAISTGTHGTGAGLGGIATQVAALELVLADGSVVSCSAEQRPDLFNAARVSVGALGVISTVTLQCVPAFALAAHEAPMHVDQVLERFDEFAAVNDHFEFYWFPYGTNALLKQNNRTGAGRRGRDPVADAGLAALPRVRGDGERGLRRALPHRPRGAPADQAAEPARLRHAVHPPVLRALARGVRDPAPGPVRRVGVRRSRGSPSTRCSASCARACPASPTR